MRQNHVPPPTEQAAENEPKELRFVGSARDDMRDMPEPVEDDFGFALWQIQTGRTPSNASPFEGSIGSSIMKLTERHDGATYRCVYAAKFEKIVYVLHVFQKKSKSGIATPQSDIELVRSRYQAAKEDHDEEFGQEK